MTKIEFIQDYLQQIYPDRLRHDVVTDKLQVLEVTGYGLPVTGEIIVPCREGAVRVLELQVPGKKRMDVKAFLNGLH